MVLVLANQSTNTCNKYDCGNNGILKVNASKILCPLNDKGISICDFNTCCDNIPISCIEALAHYCPIDGYLPNQVSDKHSCVICAGKNQENLHNLPNSKINWKCTNQDILNYCERLPEESRTFTVGWYQSGDIPYANICDDSINCPKGSTFVKKTTDSCTQIKWPIKSERTICELNDGALPTDEVIDVRKLGLNPGFITKNNKREPTYEKDGVYWKYYYPNEDNRPIIISNSDPRMKILNSLYENFNLTYIATKVGVDSPVYDYMILFITADGSTKKEGKHYNYTFIDYTGDNYVYDTYDYGIKDKDYNSKNPQICYIIKS